MRFDWDELKSFVNYKKHGIWFEEAQTVWADTHASEFFDPEHSDTEDRYIRVGHSSRSRLLIVVFCEQSDAEVIRIVSARLATKKERDSYEEGI